MFPPSFYLLKYHPAGFSSICVHAQYAHYIKKIWIVLDGKPDAEPIIFKIIILYFYTLYAILFFVAA